MLHCTRLLARWARTGLWDSQSQRGSGCNWSAACFCACLCANSSLFSLFQLTGRPLACLLEPLQGALPCECVCVSVCVCMQCPFMFASLWIGVCRALGFEGRAREETRFALHMRVTLVGCSLVSVSGLHHFDTSSQLAPWTGPLCGVWFACLSGSIGRKVVL